MRIAYAKMKSLMKSMSTTPTSKKSLRAKTLTVVTAAMMLVATPGVMNLTASADQYDDQIRQLQNLVNQYQSQADEIGARAQTLQAELDKITAEKNALQAQLDLSEAKLAHLQQQIKETEQKIADNRDALGETIADMYVADSVSPLEMLASSNNIADYIDKQEYSASIRDNLTKTIEEIQELKAQLEKDKADVEKVVAAQKDQRASLVAKEAQQASVVEQTRGEEAAYQQLISDANAQMEQARIQQLAYFDSLRNQNGGDISGVIGSMYILPGSFSGNITAGGGYPYGGYRYPCWTGACVDEWSLFYLECVSYAAWRIEYGYGREVNPFRGEGMAWQWEYSATKYSKAYKVSDPQPGDAVVVPRGPATPVGHLMVVESVSGDNVFVSQYNFESTGQYSTMTISKSASNVVYMRFPLK